MHHTAPAIVVALLVGAGFVVAQPSIVPPTGPIEESGRFGTRIELSQASTPGDADSTFRISAAGSYVLTGDLDVPTGEIGIEIAASDVTIDLNGYTIRGDGTSGTGVGVTVPETVSERFTNLLIEDGSFRDLQDCIKTSITVRSSPDDLSNSIDDTTVRRIRVTDVVSGLSIDTGRIEDSSLHGANFGITIENGSVDSCHVTLSAPGPQAPTGIDVTRGRLSNSTVTIESSTAGGIVGVRLREADATDCTVLLSGSNPVGFSAPNGTALISGCVVRPLLFGSITGPSVAFDAEGTIMNSLANGTDVGFQMNEGAVRGCVAIDVTTPADLDPVVNVADNNF